MPRTAHQGLDASSIVRPSLMSRMRSMLLTVVGMSGLRGTHRSRLTLTIVNLMAIM